MANTTPFNKKNNIIEDDNPQLLKSKRQQDIVDVGHVKTTKDRNGKPDYQNKNPAKIVSQNERKSAVKGKKDGVREAQKLNTQQTNEQKALNTKQNNQKKQDQLKRDNQKENRLKEEGKDLFYNMMVDEIDMEEAQEINAENKEKEEHEFGKDAVLAAMALKVHKAEQQKMINQEIEEEIDEKLKEQQKKLDDEFDLNLATKDKKEKGNELENIAVPDKEKEEELANIKEEKVAQKNDQENENDEFYQAVINPPTPKPSNTLSKKEASEVFNDIKDNLQKASDENPSYKDEFQKVQDMVDNYQQQFTAENDPEKLKKIFNNMRQDVATIIADPNTSQVVSNAADGSVKAAISSRAGGGGIAAGVEIKGDENATAGLGTTSTFFSNNNPDVKEGTDRNKTQGNDQDKDIKRTIADPFKIKPLPPNFVDGDE